MKTTIDSAGRVVLPKAIRAAANLEDGTELDIRMVGDHIRIEPMPVQISLKKKGSFIVAVPKMPQRKLTAAEVEQTRVSVIRQREESLRMK